jgi:hypothetical protein
MMMFRSSVDTFHKESVVQRDKSRVDTRALKNGLFRLRFRLSPTEKQRVESNIAGVALDTHYLPGACLVCLCMEFAAVTSGRPLASSQPGARNQRWLIKLHEDQYEYIREVLDLARSLGAKTDEDALVAICRE